jgi:hypothetical protein
VCWYTRERERDRGLLVFPSGASGGALVAPQDRKLLSTEAEQCTHPGGLLCVLLDKQRKLYYRKTHQHITHVNGEAIGSTRGICRIMNFGSSFFLRNKNAAPSSISINSY